MVLIISIAISIIGSFDKGDKPELAYVLIPSELLVEAHSVVRLSETIYDIASSREYVETVRETVTILNSRSPYRKLFVHYDKYSKSKILKANIYDAQGKLIRKIKNDQISDRSAYDGFSLYSDNRYLFVDMDYPKLPYTVEYEYQVVYAQTMNYPDWIPQRFGVAVQSSSLVIKSKGADSVLTKVLNSDHIEFVYENNLKMWSLENAVAIEHEQNGPSLYFAGPLVIVSPSKFQVEGYTGSMKDWDSFGRFIYEINGHNKELSVDLSTELDELLASAVLPEDRIELLYLYLKENMRYVSVQLGIGGWRSFDVNYVEDNKYGDCKALTYFMKELLRYADIESYPVLISSGREVPIIEDFAAPYFNHMILYVPDDDIWLECTSNNFPTGYIGASNAGKSVLLITPEGGRLSKTPGMSSSRHGLLSRDSVFIKGGVWHVDSRQEYLGVDHERCRAVQYYLAPSEQVEMFTENYALPVKKVNHLNYFASKNLDSASCTYELVLSHFGSQSGSRYFLPAVPLNKFDKSCSEDVRVSDIHLHDNIFEASKLTIAIPDGYELENFPDEMHVKDDLIGSYDLSVSRYTDRITVHRSLSIPTTTLPPDMNDRLCSFYHEIKRGDRSKVVLRAK